MNRIPLLIPELPSVAELQPYLERIDAARWYSNFGPLCREFEGALAGMFIAKNAQPVRVTTVSSCTLGLELALRALDLAPGSQVLLPALTFVATATAVVRAGLVPVAADVDPQSWLLTPEIARAACARYPLAAILPVTTFGCPHEMDGWDRFSAECGLPVVIDAAGAFGNQWQTGRATLVFSLHATKSLAAGEGGVVVSRDEKLVARVRQLSNFGINLDPAAALPVGQVDVPGTNAKLSEYHAAVGLASLAKWPLLAGKARTLEERYRGLIDGVAGLGAVWQQRPAATLRTLLCIRVRSAALRAAIEADCAGAAIETRRWYLPLINQHKGFAGIETCGALPVAAALAADLIGLPFHGRLEAADLDRITGVLAQAARQQA